jgi:hypothetical protein
LIVAGVSFEKSAFEVSDFHTKVVAAMLIVTYWRETQIFKWLYFALFLIDF